MAANKTITVNTKHCKLNYQINFAQAISKMKHRIISLVLHAHSDLLSMIERTIRYISKIFESVRQERSAPRRVKNTRNGIHFSSYKSAL